jgi:hypothetical protein
VPTLPYGYVCENGHRRCPSETPYATGEWTVAGERFNGLENGDSQERTEDSWGELLGRLAQTPARSSPVGEVGPRRDESGRKEDGTRIRPTALLRLRIAIVVALSVSGAGLAWIAVPALIGRGSSPRRESVPVVRRLHLPQGSRARRRPSNGQRPKGQRARRGRPAPRVQARRHEPSSRTTRRRRSLEARAVEPQAPSEVPPSGSPAPLPPPQPSAPTQPGPGQPQAEGGLVDGSTDSAEFGL